METKEDIGKIDLLGRSPPAYDQKAVEAGGIVEILNVSGHVQELDRNLGFWSVCGVSIIADNAWAAGAGSLVGIVLIVFLYRLSGYCQV